MVIRFAARRPGIILAHEDILGYEKESRMPQKTRTPLPKLQLGVLLYLMLAEPITCTVIYPFVNEAVRRLGITGGDEKKTGYYAGLIVSERYCTSSLLY